MLSGSDSMLNTLAPHLPAAWVKNVYSLCVERALKCVNLSPSTRRQLTTATQPRVQPTSFTQLIRIFPLYSYTPIFRQLTDTNFPFSTLSTAPIIKKKR